MTYSLAAKIIKALWVFFREIWLRDLTFRQFIRQHMALLLAWFGLIIMAILYSYTWSIGLEQNRTIERHMYTYNALEARHTEEVAELRQQVEWYRSRYYDVLSRQSQQAPANPSPNTPVPKTPNEKPVSTRPPSSDIVDRWRRITQ